MEVIKGRMYDYNNGRFLSVDPFIQSPTSTQSMNPYTYIFNNPLSGTDPTGYAAQEEIFKVTGSNIRYGSAKGGPGGGVADFKSKPPAGNGNDNNTVTTRGPQTQSGGQSGGVSGTGGQDKISFTPSEDNQFAQNSSTNCDLLICDENGNNIHNFQFNSVKNGQETTLKPTYEVLNAVTEPSWWDFLPFVGQTKKIITVRKAIKALPGPLLSSKVARTFADGLYANRKLEKSLRLFKYHGLDNKTGKKVTWLTNRRFQSEDALRSSLAIRRDWGVDLSQVTEFNVPKGTWISEGYAASQGAGYAGGGYQAVITNVPKSWIVRTDKAFK